MLNRDSFYHTVVPLTKIEKDCVSIECSVTLASCVKMKHVQYAVADAAVLDGHREETKRLLWAMIYKDVACHLEQIAADCPDPNTVEKLHSLVAHLAT